MKNRFCDDHKKQLLIMIFILVFTIVPAIITIRTSVLPESNKDIYDASGTLEIYNFSSEFQDVDEVFQETDETARNDIIVKAYDSSSRKTEIVEPKTGEIYKTKTRTGATLEYMIDGGKAYTDYTSPDGKRKSYYVVDMQGNLVDHKFPYKLDEYTVVIPQELELRRSERPLQNGWKFVTVELKWDGRVEMVLDPDGKLQRVAIEGGCRTNHKMKTLVAGRIDKTTKWMKPN